MELQKRVDTFHKHGIGCGHIPIKHGNHVDYIVDNVLHYPHVSHCDDHGKIILIKENALSKAN